MMRSPAALKIEANVLIDAAEKTDDYVDRVALTAAAYALRWAAGYEDFSERPVKVWSKPQ